MVRAAVEEDGSEVPEDELTSVDETTSEIRNVPALEESAAPLLYMWGLSL